jgi:hypothetical protein
MSFVKARSGGFGMDAELASKLSLKFDTGRAAAAIKWIADLNGHRPRPLIPTARTLKLRCEQGLTRFLLEKWAQS